MAEYGKQLGQMLMSDGWSLGDETNKLFGLDPTIANRPNILPVPARDARGNKDWGNWIAPEWLAGLAGAFATPGYAAQGYETTPAQATNFAVNVAGAGMGGSQLAPSPSGSIGMFAGQQAKTADHNALALAKQLREAHTDPKQIWNETGWFHAPDGNWKFEIPDHSSVGSFTTGVPDIYGRTQGPLSHPQMFEAYPQLADIQAVSAKQPHPQGSFAKIGDYSSIGAYGPNEGAVRSAALHEYQHAIQNREGFAGGGSPENALDDWISIVNKEMSSLASGMASIKEYERKSNPDIDSYFKMMQQRYEKLMSMKLGETPGKPDAFEAYKRMAGEVESRAVQKRMDYTPEQRRQIFPLDDYDVPINQLIIRK